MPKITSIETGVIPKLDENIMLFVRLLRQVGLVVGPASMVDAVDAVRAVGLGQKQHVYHALASSLVKRHEDVPLFDQAFQLFWRNPQFHERLRDLVLPKIKLPGSEQESGDVMLQRLRDALACANEKMPDALEEIDIEFDATATATDIDRLQQKDFAGMSAHEMEMAQKAIAQLRPNLPMRPARRFRPAPSGGTLTMRAAMRDASRQFGVVLPRFQTPVMRRRPIVVLCDISGSMEQYSRVMLHFIHMLTRQHPRVSSFLFGTRLTNITRQMRHRDVDLAVEAVASLVEDWSGGTRISQSLTIFNQDWSRRVLGQGALVILITDGLDRTRDETLSSQMERLQKSASSLIWLNPLLRFDGFTPKSHSIRAMMSHVDRFLPIHSLATIMDLTESLAGVHDRKSMDAWRKAARQADTLPQQAPIYAQEKR